MTPRSAHIPVKNIARSTDRRRMLPPYAPRWRPATATTAFRPDDCLQRDCLLFFDSRGNMAHVLCRDEDINDVVRQSVACRGSPPRTHGAPRLDRRRRHRRGAQGTSAPDVAWTLRCRIGAAGCVADGPRSGGDGRHFLADRKTRRAISIVRAVPPTA